MTLLSPHFTLEELTASTYATRHSIDNTPDDSLRENGILLAEGLERVRYVLGYPMHIDSGYRCPEVNKGVGGSKDSDHMRFLAADFICPQFGYPMEIARKIQANADFVQFNTLIMEGQWIHTSFSDTPKGEILTAHFGNGPTTYTKGLA